MTVLLFKAGLASFVALASPPWRRRTVIEGFDMYLSHSPRQCDSDGIAMACAMAWFGASSKREGGLLRSQVHARDGSRYQSVCRR